MKTSKITEFWSDFLSLASTLEKDYSRDSRISEVDNLVNKLGDFSWEIGPDENEHCLAFTISPNCNPALLIETKEIVGLAPDLEKWTFYYAVPPKKDWNMVFSINSSNENSIEVSAKEWEYVLFKYPDNKFEIIIKVIPEMNLTNDDLSFAVEILLKGILGEELYMEYIDNIEVVTDFELELKSKKSTITTLGKMFSKMLF